MYLLTSIYCIQNSLPYMLLFSYHLCISSMCCLIVYFLISCISIIYSFHIFLYSYYSFIHIISYIHIYSYSLYHLCIKSFMRFYHDLAIHVLSIFLSCMLLLIHVFLSCSIYSFMYDNHIFISYTLIFISCHLLVTSYILLTYIFMYFIRLSYLMTYTYTFLYLYVFLVLY